jgi:hypothetical protein
MIRAAAPDLEINRETVNSTGVCKLCLPCRWNITGAFGFSNERCATLETQFEGTGVKWQGKRFDDAGTDKISIDGGVVGIVNQYGPERGGARILHRHGTVNRCVSDPKNPPSHA